MNRDSEERARPNFKALFEATPSPYLVLTPEFLITAVNEAYLKVTSTERSQILGRTIFHVFPENPQDRSASGFRNCRSSLERVLREKTADVMAIQKYDIRARSGEFEEHYWSIINTPVLDDAGELVHIIHRVEDVTDFIQGRLRTPDLESEIYLRARDVQAINLRLKLSHEELEQSIRERTAELAQSERRFREMANSMPQIVWTARPDGFVDWYNDWWYRYTGAVRGVNWDDQGSPMHPDDVGPTWERWKISLTTGEPYEMEYRFRRAADGQYRWHLGRAMPLRDERNEVVSWIGTNTDIHDQKMLMEELVVARAAAEKANAIKSAFLANMSHEIRTPLGIILGFTDIMKKKSLSETERDQFLETIARNGKALTRIIDDILDLAKVEAGKLDIEQVDFCFLELLDDVIDLFRERAKAKNLYLRLNVDDHVPQRIGSDPTRLRQILINIVGNAVKFTHDGGISIRVKATLQKSENYLIHIIVRDSGIGIAPEQRERLFQPFSQADHSTTRKYGGTGLGLILSKRLAQALGGDVTIQQCNPCETGGCSFVVSFLATPTTSLFDTVHAEGHPHKASPDRPDALSGFRILLADDSLDNQFLVSWILERAGACVDTVSNGLEAIRQAAKEDYDLVLMDVQMPEMDGYEATRYLRNAGFEKPIIALTAHAMAEERARSLAAGCDGHLTKPLNQSQLFATLQQFCLLPTPDNSEKVPMENFRPGI